MIPDQCSLSDLVSETHGVAESLLLEALSTVSVRYIFTGSEQTRHAPYTLILKESKKPTSYLKTKLPVYQRHRISAKRNRTQCLFLHITERTP